jgi:hypothetical protein
MMDAGEFRPIIKVNRLVGPADKAGIEPTPTISQYLMGKSVKQAGST